MIQGVNSRFVSFFANGRCDKKYLVQCEFPTAETGRQIAYVLKFCLARHQGGGQQNIRQSDKMNLQTQNFGRRQMRTRAGMTLAEVVIAMAITGLSVGGIVSGYIYCTTSAEKSGLYLAANARAMERMEEIRSVKWDTAIWPPVDQLVATNFPSKVVALDLSGSGVGVVSGTVNTEITQISVSPPLKRIRVECIWKFRGTETITSSIETCRAPDQ